MKLTCQLTPADLVAFNEYHVAHSDLHRAQRRKHRYVVPVIYFIFAGLLFLGSAGRAALIFAVFAIIWFLLSPRWLRRRYRKHFQKHVAETAGEAIKTPVTLELRDDGIHSESNLGHSVLKYSAVGQIVENGMYTYVYIGQGMALVLPEDRIARQDIDAFVTDLKKRLPVASS